MNVPSLERLRCDLGHIWQLSGPWAGELPAELVDAAEGVAMNSQHQCYHAELAMPAGVQLGQVSCTVRSGDDEWPLLLLTPGAPVKGDARQRMHIVFHVAISQASAASAKEA